MNNTAIVDAHRALSVLMYDPTLSEVLRRLDPRAFRQVRDARLGLMSHMQSLGVSVTEAEGISEANWRNPENLALPRCVLTREGDRTYGPFRYLTETEFGALVAGTLRLNGSLFINVDTPDPESWEEVSPDSSNAVKEWTYITDAPLP